MALNTVTNDRKKDLRTFVCLGFVLLVLEVLIPWMAGIWGLLPRAAAPILELALYGPIALMTVWTRSAPARYHMDKSSLWIVAGSGVFLGLAAFGSAESLLASVGFALALGFLLRGVKGRIGGFRSWSPNTLKWTIFGAGGGLVLGVIYAVPRAITSVVTEPVDKAGGITILAGIAFGFVSQLARSSALEEPIYRGFLWGALRRARMTDWVACVIQAVLFAAAHRGYGVSGPWYITTALLGGVFFGLLAWRSRSLIPSMVAHALYNTVQVPLLVILSEVFRQYR